jgi:hypothetical protein
MNLRTTNGCEGKTWRTVRYWIGGMRQAEMDLRPLDSFPQVFIKFFLEVLMHPDACSFVVVFRPGFGGV